jgi:adenylate cyclase
MADVFVSYARSTVSQAELIADELRAMGYSVWRDDQLPAHRAFSEVIEERLRAAKAVVVVWSADAKKSHWVRAEADLAREAGTLVQLSIDGAVPPMPFSQIQCADMNGWSGDPSAAGWRKVVSSVAALTGGAADEELGGRERAVASRSDEPLLAVLPFDNVSSDRELTYFSDGVSDEIRETIARGADLKVIGRGSSFQFRGAEKSAAHVAAQVKATHVLDGSVQRSGQKLRITAELVDCATETTVWSSRFDRDLSDIFALQDEIASSVAQALRVAMTLPAHPLAVDPATYDLYLFGRQASFRLGNEAQMVEAFETLQSVVNASPVFARAWADLARTGSMLWRYYEHARFPQISRQIVIDAANTALKLDPGLGVAYQALSELERFDNFAARENLHEKALQHSRNDPTVLVAAAMFHSEVGRLNEAVALAEQAARIDSMFGFADSLHAGLLTGLGRHAEAQTIWDKLLALKPKFVPFTHNALYAAVNASDWGRFDDLVERAKANGVYGGEIVDDVAFWELVRHSNPVAKQSYVNQLRANFTRGRLLQNDTIQNAVALGDLELAFELVGQYSLDDHGVLDGRLPTELYFGFAGSIFMQHNRPMMVDIRFVELCHKIGLCAYWVTTGHWPDCADQLPYDFRTEARRLMDQPG